MMAREAWRTRGETLLLDRAPLLRVFEQSLELRGSWLVDGYLRVEAADFVVVAPTREDGRVIVLRQYKHAVGRRCVTFPGGLVDVGETAAEAAARELLEETGYRAQSLIPIGDFVVNGNWGCGRAHIFRASGCEKLIPPASGDLEGMEVQCLSPAKLRLLFMKGEIASLPHAAAYGLAF